MNTTTPAPRPEVHSDIAALLTLLVPAAVVGGLVLMGAEIVGAWGITSPNLRQTVLHGGAAAAVLAVATAVAARTHSLRRAHRIDATVQPLRVGALAGIGFGLGRQVAVTMPLARSLEDDNTGTGLQVLIVALALGLGVFAGLKLKRARTDEEERAERLESLLAPSIPAAFTPRPAGYTPAQQADARAALAALDTVWDVFVRTADAGAEGEERVGNAVTTCLQHVEESEGIVSLSWKANPALGALVKATAAWEEAAELRARPASDITIDDRCRTIADAYGVPVQPPHPLADAVARVAAEERNRAAAAVGLPSRDAASA